VPFKFNSKGRHHIPRQRHRVTNWRDYDTALRNRGSSLSGLRRSDRRLEGASWTTPGGQRHYSDLALKPRSLYERCFDWRCDRARLDRIDHAAPGDRFAGSDHTTLSRRACGLPVRSHGRIGTGELHLIVDSTGLKLRGAGEWLFEKHGTAKRHSWRKLHIGIDADTGEIVAFNLTDKDVDDASHVAPLLDQSTEAPMSFMGDGAYDRSFVLEGFCEKSERQIHRASMQRSRDWTNGCNIANPARPTCSRRRCARANELAKDDWLQQTLES